ncbi:MAG: type I-MYXAN CRISPR-associated Cas8a1/Cmx1 [Cyanobacteria bacterium P01_G01_bin.54]
MPKRTLRLFNSDTLIPHRAGIAGLALALSVLNREDAPLDWNPEFPDNTVTLTWERSDRAAVEWLMQQTYQVQDGYLNVPALNLLDAQSSYTFTQGVTSTLLQHSKQRKLDAAVSRNFTIEAGQPEIKLSYRPLLECYYTRPPKEAFNSRGMFRRAIALKGHHLPGLVECFVNGAYQETPEGFLALLFLPLACGYYNLPSYRSALVIPEVKNLTEWVKYRKQLKGRTYSEFRATGAGESGLRFLLSSRAAEDSRLFNVDYCEVYQLGSQVWDANQSYLKQAVYRIHADERMLAIYDSAQNIFRTQVRQNDKGETWLALSKVLPWIADNLISKRPWYNGFFEFFKANEMYERKGLTKMTEHLTDAETLLFNSVQGAFRVFLSGQIKQATKQGRNLDYPQVTDKVVYRLQRPSTQQEFATALVDFLSQHRSKAAQGAGLAIYGWLHSDQNWRKARDLALLAIATYQGKKDEATMESEQEIDESEFDD